MSTRRIFLEITYALMSFAALSATILFLSASCAKAGEYLGRVGSNPFCSDCTANEFAPIVNPFNPNSLTNPFGKYGNEFSPYSPNNPFATQTPKVYGGDDE